jgi:formylglycine-generating enzyme required for sulfatase activity
MRSGILNADMSLRIGQAVLAHLFRIVTVVSMILIARMADAQETSRRDPALSAPGSVKTFRDHLADGQPCAACPDMVVVPAGSFVMGSPANEEGRGENEGPQHKVILVAPFAVGRFAVTFHQWDACVADGGCNGYKPYDISQTRGNLPAIDVNRSDAKAYAAWLSKRTGKSYRLLTEAEREYVTRAGTTTPFWWGSSISKGRANYDSSYGLAGFAPVQRTVPVDTYAPNPWGLYQVHGNIWEWTEDCWNNSYLGAPTDGSAWTAGDCSIGVLRGGSWDREWRFLRSAFRYGFFADYRYDYYREDFGFRVARTL